MLCISSLAVLTACEEKPLPNAELRDPIYNDLVLIQASLEKEEAALRKQAYRTRDQWKSAKPQSGHAKYFRAKHFREMKRTRQLLQKIKYYKLRQETRKLEARKAYLKAFRAKEPWPDPKEYERYEHAKSLKNAPRNWDKRVPRLQDRIDAYNEKFASNKVK